MANEIAIKEIRLDSMLRLREFPNPEAVESWRKAFAMKAEVAPVVVFYDGLSYWLADGFSRIEAAKLEKASTIPFQKNLGTEADAFLFAIKKNPERPIKYLQWDNLGRLIWYALKNDFLRQKSDSEIAILLGVDRRAVERSRKRIENGEAFKPHVSASIDERVKQIKALSDKGFVAAQIGEQLKISDKQVRRIAYLKKIRLPDFSATKIGTKRFLDAEALIEQIVIGLEASSSSLVSLGLPSLESITASQAAGWADSMTESLRVFGNLKTQLRKHANADGKQEG